MSLQKLVGIDFQNKRDLNFEKFPPYAFHLICEVINTSNEISEGEIKRNHQLFEICVTFVEHSFEFLSVREF